jgi:hypothetical protein
MRSALRTAAFFTTAGLAILVALSAAALLAVFLAVPSAGGRLAGLMDHPWWFVYAAPDQARAGWNAPNPLWSAAAAIAAAAVALPAVFRARALSACASPPIVLFLAVFLFCLCVEGLRVPAAYLAATDRSIAAAVTFTRAVHGGRFLGLLALLGMGLYSLEMKHVRHHLLAGVALVIAFAAAVSIPVDRTVFLAQLTFKLGDEQALWFASLVLSVVVVAAGAGAALTRRRGPALLTLGGSILLLGGRELLNFAARPLSVAAGAILLAGGAVLWLRALAGTIGTRASAGPGPGRLP